MIQILQPYVLILQANIYADCTCKWLLAQITILHMPLQLSCCGMCNLWPDSNIRITNEHKLFSQNLKIWSHKYLVRWVPVVSFKMKLISNCQSAIGKYLSDYHWGIRWDFLTSRQHFDKKYQVHSHLTNRKEYSIKFSCTDFVYSSCCLKNNIKENPSHSYLTLSQSQMHDIANSYIV